MMAFPLEVAVIFNRYINEQDIEKLSNLMTEDHTFVDSEGEKVEERKRW